jgi:hypothetical protein
MVRVVAAAAVSSGVAAALFALPAKAPANASTHLPPCDAPEGKLCLASYNKSDRASYKLYSFRDPDGRCMNYKSGWGPGDLVGWPTVFVDPSFLESPKLKAYTDSSCGDGKEITVPLSSSMQNTTDAKNKNDPKDDVIENAGYKGYAIIGAGPRFVLFSLRDAHVIKWCVEAYKTGNVTDKDPNNDRQKIGGDCDKLGQGGTSTFFVPEAAQTIEYRWRYLGASDDKDDPISLPNVRDYCFRYTDVYGPHQATEQPCTLD